jgi:hypothetical protein
MVIEILTSDLARNDVPTLPLAVIAAVGAVIGRWPQPAGRHQRRQWADCPALEDLARGRPAAAGPWAHAFRSESKAPGCVAKLPVSAETTRRILATYQQEPYQGTTAATIQSVDDNRATSWSQSLATF